MWAVQTDWRGGTLLGRARGLGSARGLRCEARGTAAGPKGAPQPPLTLPILPLPILPLPALAPGLPTPSAPAQPLPAWRAAAERAAPRAALGAGLDPRLHRPLSPGAEPGPPTPPGPCRRQQKGGRRGLPAPRSERSDRPERQRPGRSPCGGAGSGLPEQSRGARSTLCRCSRARARAGRRRRRHRSRRQRRRSRRATAAAAALEPRSWHCSCRRRSPTAPCCTVPGRPPTRRARTGPAGRWGTRRRGRRGRRR